MSISINYSSTIGLHGVDPVITSKNLIEWITSYNDITVTGKTNFNNDIQLSYDSLNFLNINIDENANTIFNITNVGNNNNLSTFIYNNKIQANNGISIKGDTIIGDSIDNSLFINSNIYINNNTIFNDVFFKDNIRIGGNLHITGTMNNPAISTNDITILGSNTNIGLTIDNTNTSNNSIINFKNNGNTIYSIGYSGSNQVFQICNSDFDSQPRITINSSGNVGIGTTNPSSKLHVNGTTNITGATNIGGTLDVTGATNIGGTLDVTGATNIHNSTVSNKVVENNVDLLIEDDNSRLQLISTDSGGGGSYIALSNALETPITTPSLTIHQKNWVFHHSGPNQDNKLGIYYRENGEDQNNNINTESLYILSTTGLTLDTSGNVGIGTNNPTSKLHIEDSTSAVAFTINNTNSSNNSIINFNNLGSTQYSMGYDSSLNTFQICDGNFSNSSIFRINSNKITVGSSNTSYDINNFNISGSFYFARQGSNFDYSNNNFGGTGPNIRIGDYMYLGHTRANNFPYIAFNGYLSSSTYVSGGTTYNRWRHKYHNGTDSKITLITANTSGSISIKTVNTTGNEIEENGYETTSNFTNIVHIGNTGNIGIGTTNPTEKLTVNGYNENSTPCLGLRNGMSGGNPGTYGAQIALGWNGTNQYQHFISTRHYGSQEAGNRIDFYTCNGTSQNTITSGTNLVMSLNGTKVGIGTTNPSERLEVYPDSNNSAIIGTAHIGYVGHSDYAAFSHFDQVGTTSYALKQSATGNTFLNSQYGKNIYFRSFNEEKMILSGSTGNLGIGTTSPTEKLHVNGDSRIDGTISYGSTNKTASLYIKGTGNNNPASRLVILSGETIVDNSSRGLTLTIINGQNLQHVSSTNYDIYSSNTVDYGYELGIAYANNLATAINNMTHTQIGILTSEDSFTRNITSDLRTAAMRVGLTKLASVASNGQTNYTTREPYAAIFYGTSSDSDDTPNYIRDVIEIYRNHDDEYVSGGDNGTDEAPPAIISTTLSSDGNYAGIAGASSVNALWAASPFIENPALICDKEGFVGIGTTSPSGKLHITSSSYDDFIMLERSGIGKMGISATNPRGIQTTDGSGNFIGWHVKSDGNVGIGTTNPTSSLHVVGPVDTNEAPLGVHIGTYNTSYSAIELISSSGLSSWIDFYNTGISGGTTDFSERIRGGAGQLEFYTSANRRMSINSSGSVGIGTTSPSSILHISGNANVLRLEGTDHCFISFFPQGNTTRHAYIGVESLANINNFTISNEASGDIIFRLGSYSEKMRILNNGNLGIGTTGPTERLDVNGNIKGTNFIGNVDGTLDNYDSTRFFRREGRTNASVGWGWISVATCTNAGSTGGRYAGEILVTDRESGDHAYIRIHWMRSYSDSNFTVINCGGFRNRITGVRVLYETSDNTYGEKILQVYVTVTSNYSVSIFRMGDDPNYGTFTALTPVVENTKTGFDIHGNELTDLDTYGFAHEEGILAGGNMKVNGNTYYGTSALRQMINLWNDDYGIGVQSSTTYFRSGNDFQFYKGGIHDNGRGNPGTNGTALLTIKDTGNVGIGTTNPSTPLHIYSDTVGDTITINNTDTGNTGRTSIRFNPNGNNWELGARNSNSGNLTNKFYLYDINSSASRLIVESSTGNVGIGITSPTEKLEVYPDSNNSAIIGTAHIGYVGHSDYAGFSHLDINSTTGYALLQSASGNTFLNSPSGKNIYFRNNNVDKMILNSSGYLGIGTTSPTTPLHIYGSGIGAGRFGYRYIRYHSTYTGTYTPTTYDPLYSLRTSGNVHIEGELHVNSDERIKYNFKDINDYEYLQKIKQLKPYTYNYINRFDRIEDIVTGFKAQEIKNIIPGSTSLVTNYIPNINKLCDILLKEPNLVIKINNINEYSLTVENKLKLYEYFPDTTLETTKQSLNIKSINSVNITLDGYLTTSNTKIWIRGIGDCNVNTQGDINTDAIIIIPTNISSNLSIGDTFEIYESQPNEKEEQHELEITNIDGENVTLNGSLTTTINEIYVYGKEINDFHTLYYNRIIPVCVAGIQEIDRRVVSHFTGSHTCYPENDSLDYNNYIGLIVISTGSFKIKYNDNIFTGKQAIRIDYSTPQICLSNVDNQKSVLGVVSLVQDDTVLINSSGEGGIWVCNKNGNLENGDYITTCEVSGYGVKQTLNEEFLTRYTVAKITCNIGFNSVNDYDTRFLLPDGTQITEIEYNNKKSLGEIVYIACFVGCTYHCG